MTGAGRDDESTLRSMRDDPELLINEFFQRLDELEALAQRHYVAPLDDDTGRWAGASAAPGAAVPAGRRLYRQPRAEPGGGRIPAGADGGPPGAAVVGRAARPRPGAGAAGDAADGGRAGSRPERRTARSASSTPTSAPSTWSSVSSSGMSRPPSSTPTPTATGPSRSSSSSISSRACCRRPTRTPAERAREAVARAAALRRGRTEPPTEIPDPLGGSAAVYRSTIERVRDLSERMAAGLFGAESLNPLPVVATQARHPHVRAVRDR